MALAADAGSNVWRDLIDDSACHSKKPEWYAHHYGSGSGNCHFTSRAQSLFRWRVTLDLSGIFTGATKGNLLVGLVTAMPVDSGNGPPILAEKHYLQPSVFTPENLLREARRQKRVSAADIPTICILDPDGDIVRSLVAAGRARLDPGWACYHTQLYSFAHAGIDFGIVGCAVGASFAVLVAEQMFASGCKLLISMTSSGQILPIRPPPYFITIDRALRDEGTSYHYMAPSAYTHANRQLLDPLQGAFDGFDVPVITGATWTTDAPFRETQAAIEAMREKTLLAVEMEAAALYAFAEVRKRPVLCFAHVTNQMGRVDGDFEKGEADGSKDALNLIALATRRLRARLPL